MFKPKIFISSTFDLQEIRKKIEDIFTATGAEPLIYERNLTPSYQNAIYREEIQHSDFAIFIFDKRYGSKTEEGISGTHEEFLIANNFNVPYHIYININDEKDKDLKLFLDDNITNKMYSFYYYKNVDDLLAKVSQSIFAIAREIVKNKIVADGLEYESINKLVFNYDYKIALQIIKIWNNIFKRYNLEDCIDYYIIGEIFGNFNFAFDLEQLFINNSFRVIYKPIKIKSEKYAELQSLNTVTSRFDKSRNSFKVDNYEYVIRRVDKYDHLESWITVKEALLEYLNELSVLMIEFENFVFSNKKKYEIQGLV